MPAQNLQPTTMLAKLFMLSSERIRQLLADGILEADRVKGRNMFDLLPNIQRYIKFLQDRAYSRDKNEESKLKEDQKLEAEIDLKRAKARKAQLELDELEGKLHSADDVEAMTTDLCLAMKKRISGSRTQNVNSRCGLTPRTATRSSRTTSSSCSRSHS